MLHKILNIGINNIIVLQKGSISRPNDLDWLVKTLPKRLSDTSGCLYMIGNPRGYGKSALVKEMAYKRDKICKDMKHPSGPTLFTDFAGVKDSNNAEKKLLETIRPLFIPVIEFKNEHGNLCFAIQRDLLLFYLKMSCHIN